MDFLKFMVISKITTYVVLSPNCRLSFLVPGEIRFILNIVLMMGVESKTILRGNDKFL